MPVIQPTAEQYARMMTLLLPPGRLRSDVASNVYKLLLGASEELERVSGRVADMLAEADPLQVSELLPEFEEMLGLTAGGIEADRRAAVISHLKQNKLRRPADYKAVLASILGLDPVDVQVIEHSRAHALLVGDDQEIYRFFVYRDPLLPGTYDVGAAQSLLDSMSHSHTKGHVIESVAFKCDDPYSLCDRDILGGGVPATFQVLTGLTPDYIWSGTSVDEVVAETLNAVGTPREQETVVGLRVNNNISNQALGFDDNTTDAWELAQASTFDFDSINGPSWLFVLVLRTTGGAPAASRTIYGDRAAAAGAEVLMNSSGHLLWTVGTTARSLAQNYGDDDWHVLAVRWRYDTDETDAASEVASIAPAAAAGVESSAAAARFGAGQVGRPAALGCQLALFAAISGDQVHGVDLSTLAASIHALLMNPVYNAS